MSIRTDKQVSYVPPYYFIDEDQEQRIQSLSHKRPSAKRRWRSLLSRRSARR